MLILILQMWKQIHRDEGVFFCRDIMDANKIWMQVCLIWKPSSSVLPHWWESISHLMLNCTAVTNNPHISVACSHQGLFLTHVVSAVGWLWLCSVSSLFHDPVGRVVTIWDIPLSWQRENTSGGILWWTLRLLFYHAHIISQSKSHGQTDVNGWEPYQRRPCRNGLGREGSEWF